MGLNSKACFAFAKQENSDNLVCFFHEDIRIKISVKIYLKQKCASFVSVFIIFVGFFDTESFLEYYFNLLNIFIVTVNVHCLAVCGQYNRG